MSKNRYVSEVIKRLRQWYEIQMVRPVAESPDITGGRDGELVLRQLIGSSLHVNDADVFAGRRIPSKRQGRRREIDLIVCTPDMIHLIEVKNWSGRLDVRNGDGARRGAAAMSSTTAIYLETNLIKRTAVVEYLADRGIAARRFVVRDHLVPEIVFMNPRMELDPAIEALPEVFSQPRSRPTTLERQSKTGVAPGMFASIIKCCFGRQLRTRTRDVCSARFHDDSGQRVQRYRHLPFRNQDVGPTRLYGTKVVAGDVIQAPDRRRRRSESHELADDRGRSTDPPAMDA